MLGGQSAVGGMAVFPEQNVHFGRGPRAVFVICVAIGSAEETISRILSSGRCTYSEKMSESK
jgi:hypothetical protein